MYYKRYTNEAVELLSQLISTPSVSRDEKAAADLLQRKIKEWKLPCKRIGNNLIVAKRLSKKKPTLLLNAHIDTVKPVATWTRDPFEPTIEDGFVFAFLQKHMKSELKARSFRLHSSSIPEDHPLIKKCKQMRMKPFGSPTLSDQALMPFPSFKLGPGESSRSHTADEFIGIDEIHKAIKTYVKLIRK
jgi:acetylornithine deacetylase/succinyl-diaminopimelate desuccinylase-like protein